jgi:hypothetical protein
MAYFSGNSIRLLGAYALSTNKTYFDVWKNFDKELYK